MAEACKHRKLHEEFSATFAPETVEQWSRMVDEWNKDPFNAPNPYQEPEPGENAI